MSLLSQYKEGFPLSSPIWGSLPAVRQGREGAYIPNLFRLICSASVKLDLTT